MLRRKGRNERSGQRGFALLEAVISIAVLGLVVTAAMETMSASIAAARRLELRERALLHADRVVTAVALLGRDDLDRRLGAREVGGFVVVVQRPEPDLYTIAVHDAGAAGGERLSTAVYRPQANR